MAVCIANGAEVKKNDAKAAFRSRSAMKWCPRGAKLVTIAPFRTWSFLLSPPRRGRTRRNTEAWTRTTRSGARSLLVDLVACAVIVRVVGGPGVKGVKPKPLLKSDAPSSDAHEGPKS